ncbi:hypothetical protein K438DRAFT_2027813 [Mycena galopus ATCC 62051]|nr:hypothetical protein K438DRAFT_2027813 [Mycena galopus ATCC 62051]
MNPHPHRAQEMGMGVRRSIRRSWPTRGFDFDSGGLPHAHAAPPSAPAPPSASPPSPLETHALEAGSLVSLYSLGNPHMPQLEYSYGETMGAFGILGHPEDTVKYEGLVAAGHGPDGNLGPLDI